MDLQEKLKILKPEKIHHGFSELEDGSKVPVTLYMINGLWRTVDDLGPLALRKKVADKINRSTNLKPKEVK